MKFKSHSFKEKIYKKRKSISNQVKISPSLTQRRSDLLRETNEICEKEAARRLESNNDDTGQSTDTTIMFTFGNVHGELKAMLSKPYKGRVSYGFDSLLEFQQLKRMLSIADNNEFITSNDPNGDHPDEV